MPRNPQTEQQIDALRKIADRKGRDYQILHFEALCGNINVDLLAVKRAEFTAAFSDYRAEVDAYVERLTRQHANMRPAEAAR